ncbi:glycosyltransferase, partial [bacterium]|nr:glycosyltransferase [bacterium]
RAFKKDFDAIYPDASDKVTCICNPLDIESVQRNAKKDVAPKCKYFVHVSRLDIDKDIKTVIRAFDIFSTHHKDVKLYIIGDGVQRQYLQDLAKNNQNIIFTGQINEPYHMISGAKALILSSTITIGEGLGVVLIEAQALGTLAISSNVPSGPAEVLMNGDAGILFESRNVNQLADIMQDVIENPKKYKSRIQTATKNLDRFSARERVKQMIDLIENQPEKSPRNSRIRHSHKYSQKTI